MFWKTISPRDGNEDKTERTDLGPMFSSLVKTICSQVQTIGTNIPRRWGKMINDDSQSEVNNFGARLFPCSSKRSLEKKVVFKDVRAPNAMMFIYTFSIFKDIR
jgi:hypothetical protein